jgi:hypothetical protein
MGRRFVWLALILAALGLSCPSALTRSQSIAAPSESPAFLAVAPDSSGVDLVGGNFPIASTPDTVSAAHDQAHPAVAFNPARSEYLIVWDASLDVTSDNIYARFLSSSGAPLGNPFAICEAPGSQVAPSVVFEASSGQYWVVWTDFREGQVSDIYARPVSATGGLGAEMAVNTGGAMAFAGRVAAGGGRIFFVWASQATGQPSNILVRSYEGSGGAATSVFLLSDPANNATEPDVCFNGDDGHILVVWYEQHASTGWDIMAFPLTSSLGAAGARFTVSGASGHQQKPRAAYSAAADRYLVVWQDGRSLQSWDVYGQVLDRSRAPVGGALGIFVGDFFQGSPVVASHASAAQFAVAFERDITGAGLQQIYLRTVSGTGAMSSTSRVREWHQWRKEPAIAAGGSEYLVAWADYWPFDQPDIQAQRMSSNGSASGPLIIVSAGRSGQEVPSVAYGSAANEYLVVWSDARSGTDSQIGGRMVSAAGALPGGEVLVYSGAELLDSPEVGYSTASNEYLVIWVGIHPSGNGLDVYGRRVGANGQPLAPAFWISRDTGAINEGFPSLAYNPAADEYLVVWHAWNEGWRIWGQRVSGTGQLRGSNFRIIEQRGVGEWPRAAYNPVQNEYLVVWFDQRNEAGWALFGQRVSGAGALAGANIQITTTPFEVSGGSRLVCDVAYHAGAGEYLAVWGDDIAGKVMGQRLGGAGALVGSNVVLSGVEEYAVGPSAGYDRASGEYLVAWQEHHQGSTWDVMARRVSASGTAMAGVATIAGTSEVQSDVRLAQNTGNGEFLLVWQDFRSGSFDVYGQRWQQAAVPTTPTTAPPTRTPTVTQPAVTATRTIAPSRTATRPAVTLVPRLYLPVVIRALPFGPVATPTPTVTTEPGQGGISGRVTCQGAPAAGLALSLHAVDDSGQREVGVTNTAGDGVYRFNQVPGLPAGEIYYVRFGPNAVDPRYVAIWFGPDILSYAPGASVAGGDFDIANVELVAPATGSSVGLPAAFAWRRRGIIGDSYMLRLEDPANDDNWSTGLLGDVDSFTVSELATGMVAGREYRWYVQVSSARDSFGFSYYARRVTFLPGSAPGDGRALVPGALLSKGGRR